MKTALLVSIACLFVGVHHVSAVAVQDDHLLLNLYTHQVEMNPTLLVDPFLEKLAQSYDNICGDHSFHERTDDQVLNKFGNMRANLRSFSQWPEAYKSGDSKYDKPAWTRSTAPEHYAALMASNRMGCSAVKYGNKHCMFCYYATEDETYLTKLTYKTICFTETIDSPCPTGSLCTSIEIEECKQLKAREY